MANNNNNNNNSDEEEDEEKTTTTTTTTTSITPTRASSALNSCSTTPIKEKPQPPSDTDIIRSMWETPAIYQYLTFFKVPLGLKIISSDDLEFSLLNPKGYSKLLADIFIVLLKDLLPATKAKTISYSNWELFLKQELNKENNFFSCFQENPFLDNTLFASLTLKNRVLLLKAICDWNLSKSPHILEHVKQFLDDTDKLRNLPMGILNDQKEFYWYFGDYRLYKETLLSTPTTPGRGKNRKDANKEDVGGKWEIVCSTREEWDELIKQYEPYSLEEEESDEKTLYINLNEVYPQVQTKLSSSKRKKTITFGGGGGGGNKNNNRTPVNMNEPKQWKSMRMLSNNLKKKEQDELMEIQQAQQHQLDLDPFNRPRSGRIRTNLYFNDEGILKNSGVRVKSTDPKSSNGEYYSYGADDDYEDEDDMIGGGNSRKKTRGNNNNNNNNTDHPQEENEQPTIHYSRSGRRMLTAGVDEYGRPISVKSLSLDQTKKFTGDIIYKESKTTEDNNNTTTTHNEGDDKETNENDKSVDIDDNKEQTTQTSPPLNDNANAPIDTIPL